MASPYAFTAARRVAEYNAAQDRLREARHKTAMRAIDAEIKALHPSAWSRLLARFRRSHEEHWMMLITFIVLTTYALLIVATVKGLYGGCNDASHSAS